MNIHELNTKTPGSTAYIALDDGTDTYKANFPGINLQNNPVSFTSGDSSTPTAWTSVSVMSSGSSLSTLLNRISTMVKNVRYLYDFIGTTAMGTTATTITGAVEEVRTSIPPVDSVFDGASTNPVQNAVITNKITDMDTLIGNTPMGTTATTVTGAISEINTTVNNLGMTVSDIVDGAVLLS